MADKVTAIADKPLHVRVAEALGCTPELVKGFTGPPWWTCGCSPGYRHNYDEDSGLDGMLLAFDTDWAVTGPLIEKYGIGVDLRGAGWAASKFPEDFSWPGIVHFAPTPLIAVCNLILALKEAERL